MHGLSQRQPEVTSYYRVCECQTAAESLVLQIDEAHRGKQRGLSIYTYPVTPLICECTPTEISHIISIEEKVPSPKPYFTMTITTITPMTKGPTDRPGCEVKNILITGGAGFIGSWMCHHLVHQYEEQYSVVCLDRLSNVSTLNNLKSVLDRPNFHFVQGNLHDKERLIKIMDEYNIDSVIHFAAESSVQKSFSDPAAFVDMNVCATFRLLEAMNAHGKITRYLLQQPISILAYDP